MADVFDSMRDSVFSSMARLFRPIQHAESVLQVPPVWVRASSAEVLFGLKREKLNDLVAKHKVIAKKADKVVLYKYMDIIRAIDDLPDFEGRAFVKDVGDNQCNGAPPRTRNRKGE